MLAGGSGLRLASVTGGIPKQFWHSGGTRSLLELTLERVAPLAPPDRTLIVVDATHRSYVHALPSVSGCGRVLFQPADRGTAAGVLLPLMAVLDSTPDALVLLTPSDHGVAQSSYFRAGIREVVSQVHARTADIVLFGVQPTTANGDYGWIAPGRAPLHQPLRRVAEFVEKPLAAEAQRLFAAGAIWNTMVLVARAAALFDLYSKHLPHLARVFASDIRAPAPAREALLAEHYHRLPLDDFSRGLLGPAQGLSVYTWPTAMGWSDLGTPDRFEQWIAAEAGRSSSRVTRDRRVA